MTTSSHDFLAFACSARDRPAADLRAGVDGEHHRRRPPLAAALSVRLVEVCARLSDPDTRAREFRALQAGMSEIGAGEATLITLYEEEAVRLESGVIRVVPAWRWLLEGARAR